MHLNTHTHLYMNVEALSCTYLYVNVEGAALSAAVVGHGQILIVFTKVSLFFSALFIAGLLAVVALFVSTTQLQLHNWVLWLLVSSLQSAIHRGKLIKQLGHCMRFKNACVKIAIILLCCLCHEASGCARGYLMGVV